MKRAIVGLVAVGAIVGAMIALRPVVRRAEWKPIPQGAGTTAAADRLRHACAIADDSGPLDDRAPSGVSQRRLRRASAETRA